MAVLDNSVLVSALINRRGWPARILCHLSRNRFWLVLSPPMLREFHTVTQRSSLREKYRFSEEDVQRAYRLLRSHARAVQVSGRSYGCRDPKDDILIETAILGEATHLVTRDDDIKDDIALISLLRKQRVEVTSVSNFLGLLEHHSELP